MNFLLKNRFLTVTPGQEIHDRVGSLFTVKTTGGGLQWLKIAKVRTLVVVQQGGFSSSITEELRLGGVVKRENMLNFFTFRVFDAI